MAADTTCAPSIGNAKILNSNTNDDLLQTNHMTNTQYIIALMVFLVAYSIFEAPSNLVLKALSPSKYACSSPAQGNHI